MWRNPRIKNCKETVILSFVFGLRIANKTLFCFFHVIFFNIVIHVLLMAASLVVWSTKLQPHAPSRGGRTDRSQRGPLWPKETSFSLSLCAKGARRALFRVGPPGERAAHFNSKVVMQNWIFERPLTPLNPNLRVNPVSGLTRGPNGGIGMVGG